MSESKIYGIDLGTTYSCVSHIDSRSDLAEIIEDHSSGERLTPSVVFFQTDNETGDLNPVVGYPAKDQAKMAPDRVVKLVKRHMPDDTYRHFEVEGESFDPVDISAMILKHLVTEAAKKTGEQITDVVITVPAYFGSVARDRTVAAGKQAGLTVHGVLPEPMAAALHYDLHELEDEDQTILIYDLGGGTFDVTIMSFHGHNKETLAIKGDPNLGGCLWDQALARHWAEAVAEQAEADVDEVFGDPETHELLEFEAEVVKKRLSSGANQTTAIYYLGRPYQLTIDRATFAGLTSGLLDRTVSLVDEAINVARKKDPDLKIDRILLVGGSTLMPQVSTLLEEKFGDEIELMQREPHHAVALGAAKFAQRQQHEDWIRNYVDMHFKAAESRSPDEDETGTANVLEGLTDSEKEQVLNAASERTGLDAAKIEDLVSGEIIDVSPKSFGIKHFIGSDDDQHYVTNLVQAQQRIPASGTKRFSTRNDDQRHVELVCVENDRELGMDDEPVVFNPDEVIGKVEIELDLGLPAGSPIDVTINYDKSGIVHVYGKDAVNGRVGDGRFESEIGYRTEEEINQKREKLDKTWDRLGDGR